MPELLSRHTTLRLGGPAARWVRAESDAVVIEAVRRADAADDPVLVLGGGSNLVVADAGFAGTVVELATSGILSDVDPDDGPSCGGVLVTVAAGEGWDAFVAHAVAHGWVGVEALAGIPGSVGATPIQNVGAYGQEVAQSIATVRTWDRTVGAIKTFANADCGFGYRHSRFKADPGRYVVLGVTFQLRVGSLSEPVTYAELARTLGVEQGQRADLAAVRETVLDLRRDKGMVLDADDHDTWSAGSFFTNPVLTPEAAAALPDAAPRWEQADGIKTSAAWLIQAAGFDRGYGNDRVSLSTKHPLALTNRGPGTTEDLLALAREVRDGVESATGVRLVNEPVLLGATL